MAVPSPATSTTVSSKHITQSIFKHMIVCMYVCMQREHEVFWGLTEILQCFPISKHSNLSSNISKCSGLGLDLPLSMKAVRVSQGHRLSHCYFRASAINTQQVLPCLLWDLTVVCTWRGETHIKRKRVSTNLLFSFPSSHPSQPALRFTLLELYVSSFHYANFTVVNGTWRLWENKVQKIFFFKIQRWFKCITV